MQLFFNHILDLTTLPWETAAPFKAEFFDIILKPVIRIIERNNSVIAEKELSFICKNVFTIVMSVWQELEPSLSEIMAKVITQVLNVSKWEDWGFQQNELD